MQDKKIYVLSTRPLEESLVAAAVRRNIVIHSTSFIRTEPVIDDTLENRINEVSSQSRAVVFTSMNAAEAVGANLTGKPTDWKIYCLGTATNKVVELYFGPGQIAGTAQNALLLADEIIRDNIKDVLFFCGNQRRDELPAKLARHQIQVEEVVVYRTLTLPRQIERNYNGILFFSPSAVESFFSSNTLPAETILFAIGATTAGSIRQFSNNTVIESDVPGKENLVEKAIRYLDKSNHPNEQFKE